MTPTEPRPQGDHPEGRQEHLEHPEHQAPLGREDQGREVRLQTGNQEQEIRQPVMTTRDRGDMDRCRGEEYLVDYYRCRHGSSLLNRHKPKIRMMVNRQQQQQQQLPRMR